MKSNRLSLTSLITAALALTLTPGCHHDQQATAPTPGDPNHNYSAPEISETTRLENTQKANGALADATLYTDHFDSATLNSLGVTKLDLLLAAYPKAGPLVVYINVPSDDSLNAGRKQAVAQYLTQHGLTASQIDVEVGTNPATYHPSAPDIANYPKTDTAADAGGDTSTASH